MLPNALFSVAIVAALITAMLSAGIAVTRAGIARLASSYVTAGYQTAIRSAADGLAADMQSGGLPSPLPAPSALPTQCVAASCRYSIAESVKFTSAASAPSGACETTQTNCAAGEQGNVYVDEGRVTAHLSVVVSDANGNALVTRGADATFRTFRRPPYVAFAGFRDGSFDDVANGNAPGDDGGMAPATPNPCSSSSPGTTDDTAVRVAYQNAQSSACSDGSTFRSQSYSQPASGAAGWSP